jgi:phage terminase small subunit
MSAIVQSSEPQPELGPAMRALPLRWQRAVTALFVTKGNRSAALRAAGYKAQPNSLHVLASRIFADDRVRAAVRECAARMIEIAEPELLATTLDIMRDTATRPADRLAAARMVWDRANPVLNKTKIEVEHHLSSDELDAQHYRAF